MDYMSLQNFAKKNMKNDILICITKENWKNIFKHLRKYYKVEWCLSVLLKLTNRYSIFNGFTNW